MGNKKDNSCYWLLGGLIGLFLPLILFGLFLLLNNSKVTFGENPLTVLLVFVLALIELPIAIIGRVLWLPIETGKVAFLMYDFTILGYILTIMFWALVGILFGWLIDRRVSKSERAI